jgi:hypothetical protein
MVHYVSILSNRHNTIPYRRDMLSKISFGRIFD